MPRLVIQNSRIALGITLITQSGYLWQQAGPADGTNDDGDSGLNDIVQALREERRTIAAERQPVSGGATGSDVAAAQVTGTEARAAGWSAETQQPAPHTGLSQAALVREGSGVPATNANTVPLAQPRWAASAPIPRPHGSLDPGSDADPAPPASVDRRAAAACSALLADAPGLLETLKRHGLAQRLALLDDVSAVGRSGAAAGAGGSALSQVLLARVKTSAEADMRVRVRVRDSVKPRVRVRVIIVSVMMHVVCIHSFPSLAQFIEPFRCRRPCVRLQLHMNGWQSQDGIEMRSTHDRSREHAGLER